MVYIDMVLFITLWLIHSIENSHISTNVADFRVKHI